jgi:galactose mutarotase-like enzyme
MIVLIQNQKFSAKINSLGAELISLNNGDKNFIWTIDELYWNKTSPILFPIVGRLKNDSYISNRVKYSLSRHGFARNFEFLIIDKKENSVTFSLNENHETLAQYPFLFELQICYTLEDNKLVISYIVKNNSDQEMPFSIGAHPAFAIDSDLANYTIQFENDEELITHELENEQFSGKTKSINLKNKTLPLSYSLFEKDAIVLKKMESKNIIILKNQLPYLKINFGDFPNLGIWTKKNAPFLCIEPWHGYADSANANGRIEDKEGIIVINKGDSFETSFSIEIL